MPHALVYVCGSNGKKAYDVALEWGNYNFSIYNRDVKASFIDIVKIMQEYSPNIANEPCVSIDDIPAWTPPVVYVEAEVVPVVPAIEVTEPLVLKACGMLDLACWYDYYFAA